jgi:hypothetical protein
MKTTRKFALALVIFCMGTPALMTGCVYEGPPANVAVVGIVPDYCFWDGFEYVGWYGGQYYYWGPNRVWIGCDPVRVQRVNVWVNAHPDWRTSVTTVAPARVIPAGHPEAVHVPPARRYYHEHDEDHDRN